MVPKFAKLKGQIMEKQENTSGRGAAMAAFKLESLARKNCCRCGIPLNAFLSSSPEYCVLCSSTKRFNVYVSFELSDGLWRCAFRPWHLKSILRVVTFRDSARILEMARIGNMMLTESTKRYLDREILSGSGNFWLHLDSAQHERLCGPNPKA